MSPAQVVTDFIAAIERGDLDAALGMVTDDVVYDNVPLGAVNGPDGIRSVLGPFLDGFDRVEWAIHHQLEQGDVVMNERTDRFHAGGRWVELPVAGLFVVREGRIALWRDYFDAQTLTAAMAPAGS